ncbi:MAG: hypothetical protein DSY80_04180 [Desulfocapsa sp.]|nr:MAG: hypothetical protein DSY80_04180 [Desulfocapsa sp.]
MKRRLSAAARAGLSGDLTTQIDQFGYRVHMYNDIPILLADYNNLNQRIIRFNEFGPAGAGGGAVCSSIYIASFRDGYVTGIQNGGIEVEDLGDLKTLPMHRTRVEWLVGLAVQHGRAISRIWGITDAPVTL